MLYLFFHDNHIQGLEAKPEVLLHRKRAAGRAGQRGPLRHHHLPGRGGDTAQPGGGPADLCGAETCGGGPGRQQRPAWE